MRSFVRTLVPLFASGAITLTLTQCTNHDSVSPHLRAVRRFDGVTYPLVTYTGAVTPLPVGDSEIVSASIQMAADSAVRPCPNCYFASTNESVVHIASTSGWGTQTVGHIYGVAAGTASFYSDTVGNSNAIGTFQVVVSAYPQVTYKGAVDTLTVGDSELVSTYIQMAADSAVRPCGNCYFASSNENIVQVASTTGWGTQTVGHIHLIASGSATFYSDTVGNSLGIGSVPTTVLSAVSFTPDLPSGMTAVINTGGMSVAPSQVNNGTWSSGGALPWNLTNFAPTVTDSTGFGASNVAAVPGHTGLRILFNTNLEGGGSPTNFGGGWSGNNGTGYLYVAYYVRVESGYSLSEASQIKLFEPRTSDGLGTENHIIALSVAQGASDGSNMWPEFAAQFSPGGTDAGFFDLPAAPQGFAGPSSLFAFSGANVGGSNRGSWHLVEHYIQPESPAGSNNGQHTIWVDGQLAWTSVGVADSTGGVPDNGIGYWKSGETQGWNYFQCEPTFGGDVPTDHPPSNEWIDIDHIYIAVK